MSSEFVSESGTVAVKPPANLSAAAATAAMPKVGSLLPPRETNSNVAAPSVESRHSFSIPKSWTEEEFIAGQVSARISWIKRHLKRGFSFRQEDGKLEKGKGKNHVIFAIPPAQDFFPHMPMPGAVGYNPAKHAPALFMGAEFISEGQFAGRFRLTWNGLYCDRNGGLLDPECCPECGSSDGEQRFRVRIRNPNPFAKPWEPAYTYCRRCTKSEEIEALRNRALATPPTQQGKKGRNDMAERLRI